MELKKGLLDDPQVVALLTHHHATAHAVTPKGSAHALNVDGLKVPEIDFWTAWEGEVLLGMGAWKRLSLREAEIKSMHVAEKARRRGVASAMLRHLIAEAKAAGIATLYLETGSFDYFRPAAALYRRHGFSDCAPFAGYRDDPNSLFMQLAL